MLHQPGCDIRQPVEANQDDLACRVEGHSGLDRCSGGGVVVGKVVHLLFPVTPDDVFGEKAYIM